MRQRLSAFLPIILGAWVGGLVTLFIGVQAIFAATSSREVAGLVASSVFRRVELAQLVVAGVSLLLAIVVLRSGSKSLYRRLAFGSVLTAVVLVCIGTFGLTPRIEHLRIARETATDSFKSLHATSMLIYVGQTIILLIACLVSAKRTD